MGGPCTVSFSHIISLISCLARRNHSYFMDEKTKVHSSEVYHAQAHAAGRWESQDSRDSELFPIIYCLRYKEN